ncbi:Reverse transcriptase domain-containing protein [Durusdinium trenchii]|uniref:Reverse transcriptase domain-containing protein n=1 Tax=Durusdinium trenchii TaxID=1381693 RepID=A0ABP0QUD8_9DINO
MPGLAMKPHTMTSLRPGSSGEAVTLAPVLPKPGPALPVAGAGTWVGTGICDLRASLVAQQKQLDTLVDRVAVLLSSMHAEVLQDVRAACDSKDFELRLAEMRKVGEVLDQRLAEMRAEAANVPDGLRLMQSELRRVEEKMEIFDGRMTQDFEKLQGVVTESLMSVHDRFTSEMEGVVAELKKLEGRLGSAETDLGLLGDDDLEATCRETIQQTASSLRSEFQTYVVPYFAERLLEMLSQFQHRLTRDVAFQGFVAGKMLIRCQGQSLRFASGQTSVSIHTLAIYIHEQINGTFPNIFHQLLQRVDLLEYPNDGSRTIVSLDDARVIVEDIGAHADELEAFVAEDHLLDKSIGFPEPTQEHASQEPRLRHPRYALHGFKGRLGGGSLSAEACVEDLPTQEILARIRRDAIGLWYKKDQNAARITALEDRLQREHTEMLAALHQTVAASGVQEGDRALQRDWAKRTKEDLRQQTEEITALRRELSAMKSWQAEMNETTRQMKLEQEECMRLKSLEERVASTSTQLNQLEERLSEQSETEKRLHELEEILRSLEPSEVQPELGHVVERCVSTLEEKLDLAVSDLKRQLEAQINDPSAPREIVQRCAAEVKRELEQRLLEVNAKTQLALTDLREEVDARAAQVQRQDDLRRDLELKIEKRQSSTEMAVEELSAQQQSESRKHTDDIKQLSADMEIRMVKEQSAMQLVTMELRTDLERSAQEAVNLCSEVLREEQHQLVREFREELERRLAKWTPPRATSHASPILIEGFDDVNAVREELHELREQVEEWKARQSDGSPRLLQKEASKEAEGLLRTVEDTVTEKVRRCDTAAALCERLARSMAWQVLPEAGSGMPGQAQAYEGLILKREGPWALGDARGRYAFDETTGWLTTQGSHVGRFICKRIQATPLPLPNGSDRGDVRSMGRRLMLRSGEPASEMQKKENHRALFVVPSLLHGAEYLSSTQIVRQVQDYKYHETVGARAQLAAHPAAAQFLLDNAANAERDGGLNMLEDLLSKLPGVQFVNGYLHLTDRGPRAEAEMLQKLEKELHSWRPLIMEDLCSNPREDRAGDHQVGVVYASVAILGHHEPSEPFVQKLAELLLTVQYYGALRYAAESHQRRKVFLTPMGLEMFEAPWETIGRSMIRAVQMLQDDASSLEIIVLTPTDGSGDPLEEVLHPPATQARSQRREPRGPFAERGPTRGPRMSDALPVPSDSSDEFRWSPIEESSESRITVLMRRVDMQATELQSLRRKNEELSEAMDQYNLEQKVSRSLAGLED